MPERRRRASEPVTILLPPIATRWDRWEQERIGRLQDAEDAGRITRQQMQVVSRSTPDLDMLSRSVPGANQGDPCSKFTASSADTTGPAGSASRAASRPSTPTVIVRSPAAPGASAIACPGQQSDRPAHPASTPLAHEPGDSVPWCPARDTAQMQTTDARKVARRIR